jgi:hypothetical protein
MKIYQLMTNEEKFEYLTEQLETYKKVPYLAKKYEKMLDELMETL